MTDESSTSGDSDDVEYIRPHVGPQTTFLKSKADIAFFGGSAGCGKSFALLLESGRWIDNPKYDAVIFRRTSPQITNAGGLWDESMGIFPRLGGTPHMGSMDWRFESGANIGFRHMQYEADKLAWMGSQVCMIGFDEVTHFTENQFWYLLSRNRSSCGKRPYMRCTCNPVHEDDAIGGWVHRLLQWWINPETGFAIPERSGVVRWFIRIAGEIHWGDSREELYERHKNRELPDDHEDQPRPKSLTFVPGKLSDNPTMAQVNPDYRASLMALPEHEKQQLLDGNWNAKLQAGMFFKVGKIGVVQAIPEGTKFCRGWDLAATDGGGDWTVGAKIGKQPNGRFIIADVRRGQWESNYRDELIKQTAGIDGKSCVVRLPQDPGAAGKTEAKRMCLMLAGWNVKAIPVSGDKETRATGFAAQVNAGNVDMVQAEWNHGLIQRLDAFPTKGIPDDDVDGLADAFNELTALKKLVVGI